jgi:hypothetical protein
VGCHHRDRTAGDSRSNTIRTAGENDRHPRAKNQAGAISIREKTQLFGKDVSCFKVGSQQDIRIASDVRNNAFRLRGLAADGIIKS